MSGDILALVALVLGAVGWLAFLSWLYFGSAFDRKNLP